MQVIKKILKWGAITYVFGIAGMSAIMLISNGWDFPIEQPRMFAQTVILWPWTLFVGFVLLLVWH